nr:MAG TPA_asm: hypothetical protein [Caudoviricetes sp.]
MGISAEEIRFSTEETGIYILQKKRHLRRFVL